MYNNATIRFLKKRTVCVKRNNRSISGWRTSIVINKSKKLDQLIELNERKKEEVDQMKGQHIKQLESIAGLSAEEAREQLVHSLREEARSQAIMQIKDIVDEAKLTASKEAKKVVIQ